MENKEIKSIVELRDLLCLYDAKGSLLNNGENYLYKTYFDSTKACSIILVSKETTPKNIHAIKFPYNLNEYDTKVLPGTQHRVIEGVVREFLHKEKMKILKNELDQVKKDLASLKSSHYKHQLKKKNLFINAFQKTQVIVFKIRSLIPSLF